MNMYCDDCGRDDYCLCNLDADPTAAALQVLQAAEHQVLIDDEHRTPAAARATLRHARVYLDSAEYARIYGTASDPGEPA